MAAPYRVAMVDGEAQAAALTALHTLCLPYDDLPDFTFGEWWLAFNDAGPVGFAGYQPARTEQGAVYLARAGVLSGHRGHGLQRRLIDVRLRAARRAGYATAITTTYDNPPSSNNLIRCGFRMYAPEAPWGAAGTCYWRRALTP